MAIDELFKAVESARYSAYCNVAGSLGILISALDNTPEMSALTDAVKAMPSDAVKVLNRLKLLADMSPDPAYENPNDIAMASYVLALSRISDALHPLGPLAGSIALMARQTWWARAMANHVMKPEKDEDSGSSFEAMFDDEAKLVVNRTSTAADSMQVSVDWVDEDVMFSLSQHIQYSDSSSADSPSEILSEEIETTTKSVSAEAGQDTDFPEGKR